MCGFCGMVGAVDHKELVLTNMMDRIVHRGPDSEGKFIDEGAALGFRRLSIIDVDNGAQPLTNETDETVIVFNGEIYNYAPLREELGKKGHKFKNNSDTESLLHGYEEYGVDILKKIEGMFAFAVWDSKKQRLFAARDFFGIKPFYYTLVDGVLIFGSEIKSLLEYPGYKRELNEEALEHYLSFQYSALPETFFKGIFKLEPGTYLTFEKGKLEVKRYFDPILTPNADASKEKLLTEIEDVTKDSIQRHMISDVEVGSFLSSGVDSSYITQSFGGAKTFTVGFIDNNSKYNEISYAKELSEHVGFGNYSDIISSDDYWNSVPEVMYYMDEPLADASAISLYFVNKLARQHLKVCLSGEGADELFGGYNIYHEPMSLRGYQRIPKGIRKGIAGVAKKLPDVKGKNFLIRGSKSVEERFIGNANIFSFEERNKVLKNATYRISPQQLLKKYYDQVKNLDDISKMQYIDLKCWLPGDILLKADKMGMANSMEVRVPYLDKKVFDVAKNIPSNYKVDKNNTKILFREVANKFLPQKTAEKKKLGFPTPIRVWLQEDAYYNKVKTAFNSEAAKKYFNAEEITRLLEEHKTGAKDNSRKIWIIYTFLVWYDVYFVKEAKNASEAGK